MHRLAVTRGIMGVHPEDEKIGTGEAAIAQIWLKRLSAPASSNPPI
jgi:hypothetical protein